MTTSVAWLVPAWQTGSWATINSRVRKFADPPFLKSGQLNSLTSLERTLKSAHAVQQHGVLELVEVVDDGLFKVGDAVNP